MAQDKDQKTLNVPPLRFPGFTDEWKKTTLGEIGSGFNYGLNAPAKEFDGVNKYIRITDIDESSGAYMTDDIVSPNGILTNDFIVKDNDILLARTGASTGKSYLYKPHDGKLYFAGFLIRFNVNLANPYFVYSNLHTRNYWKWVSIMSARSGQPGINSQEYSSYSLNIPSQEEQDRIASLLQLLDERIATQNKIIEDLQCLIKGLIQHLIRVGLEKGTWHNVMLSEVLQERNELNKEYYPVHSVSVSVGIVNQIEYLGRSFAAKDTAHYHVVRYGDIVYTKSPTGNQPYGIIKQSFCQNPVAVSPLYGVYAPISFEIGNILHYYFLNPLNTNNYLLPLIQKGAKNTINITNRRFLENSIPLPISNDDIISVSKTLSSLNSKIELENSALNTLLKERQYLLNMLFI